MDTGEETPVPVLPKPVATLELLDQVAKAIMRASILTEPYLMAKYQISVQDQFVKTFNEAIETLWYIGDSREGEGDNDRYHKERYRMLAKATLITLGYEVPDFNHFLDPVLV